MMWKSEIWDGLELQLGPDREQNAAEFEAWTGRIVREPWVIGLQELTEQKGWWVGTEDQLIQELRKRVSEEVSRSSDFPACLDHLYEYMALADMVFSRLGLDIEDYREIPLEELIYKFDVPEWDRDNPILVHQGSSALRDYCLRAWEHPDPLPFTLLLVAARERYGDHKRWEGSTSELMEAMCSEHSLARTDDDEYAKLFGTKDREDHRALHRRMSECRPFLEEIGVYVRRIGDNSESEVTGGAETKRDQDPAYWIIEVPAWKHKKGFAA